MSRGKVLILATSEYMYRSIRTSLVAQLVKNPPAMQKTQV